MEKNLKAVNDHVKVMHARAVWAKPTEKVIPVTRFLVHFMLRFRKYNSFCESFRDNISYNKLRYTKT